LHGREEPAAKRAVIGDQVWNQLQSLLFPKATAAPVAGSASPMSAMYEDRLHRPSQAMMWTRDAGSAAPAPVAVIVPCYNAAATLPDTIASVQRQSVRDWQMIIVDDGSSDATLDVARSAAKADPRIRILAQASAGVAAARNAGLRVACASWALFLDADDTLRPRALRRLLQTARGSPETGVVVGRSARLDRHGKTWGSPCYDLSDPFGVLAYECGVAINSALVRPELVRLVGGFDESLRSAEDWDLWQRLARAGVGFVQLDEVVALYHSRSGSLSKDVGQLARDSLTVMERGIRPDPRVPTAPPANAAGAPPDAHHSYKLNFLLWSAARALAGGDDGLSFLRSCGELPDLDVDPAAIGEMLATGMADYLAVQPAELRDRWAEFSPRLKVMLEHAFPGAERARMRDLALLAIKNRVGARFDGRDAEAIGEVGFDLADSAHPQVLQSAPAAVQLWSHAAVGVVSHSGRRPLWWGLSSQLPQLALSTALPAARPWRRLAFWRALAATLADAPGVSLLRRRPSLAQLGDFAKERIRFALTAGLSAALLDHSARDGAGRRPPRRRRQGLVGEPRSSGDGVACAIPILTYHRIAEGPPARHTVSSTDFTAQMRLLAASGFWTPSLAELREAMAYNVPFAGRPVMVTFDDGYRDFADNAWPVMRELGLGAVVFPVTAKVGGVADWEASPDPTAGELMDWATLRRLAGQGVEIGSHGATHRPFSRLSLDEIQEEARLSRERITREIGQGPEVFSYPNGLSDILVQREIADSGYALAMTRNAGTCKLTAPPFALPRIEISGFDSLAQFARKLGIT
jgi:peptidoglycan/xylan/chitin deacetylase (PgdA/CDA1 family)